MSERKSDPDGINYVVKSDGPCPGSYSGQYPPGNGGVTYHGFKNQPKIIVVRCWSCGELVPKTDCEAIFVLEHGERVPVFRCRTCAESCADCYAYLRNGVCDFCGWIPEVVP